MFRRLKLKIKLIFLKKKVRHLERRWKSLRKKETDAHQKYNAYSTNLFYMIQNLDPKRAWEMRAEREGIKSDR